MGLTIGIDQSFTSTGVVVIDENKELLNYKIISSNKNESPYQRAIFIANEIQEVIKKYKEITKINIEGLSYGSKGDATRNLAGLQFLIIDRLESYNYEIVSPQTLKKFVLKGNAQKEDMFNELPENVYNIFIEFPKNQRFDLMDAYFLAKYE